MRRLRISDDGGTVIVWSLDTNKAFQTLHRCQSEAVSCCWADDKELFIGCGNGELHVYEHVSAQVRMLPWPYPLRDFIDS